MVRVNLREYGIQRRKYNGLKKDYPMAEESGYIEITHLKDF